MDGVSRTSDVSDCRIVSTTANRPRLLYQLPPREYRLTATAAQDVTEDSLWSLIWNRAGEFVEVDLRPAGGEMPTEDQPWFTGTVLITETDGDLLGGAAEASPTTRFTFDIDWAFTAKPTRVTL
ncbi:hypothetical protein [Nocardioides sp.]|uniref:hypothetical protein n=1 Tax=Nocardioides sp. TaxID=35761 RepID=UPI00261AEB40|nr:hypothetical protein [Nocardioides sp.]